MKQIAHLPALIFLLLAVALPLGAAPAPINDNDRILAWDESTNAIVMLDGAGGITRLLDDVSGDTMPCTEQAASPDGDAYLFYSGGTSVDFNGRLYLMTSSDDDPVDLGPVKRRACLGMGTLQWRGDGEQFALLDFTDGFNDLPRGTLTVRSVDDPQTPETSHEDVAAFHFSDEGLLLVQATDADSVGLMQAGAADRLTQIFTRSSDRCNFRAAQVAPLAGDDIALLLGEDCGSQDRTWQLYRVDGAARSANRILAAPTGSPGSPNIRIEAQAAALTLLVDAVGENVALFYPDGVRGNHSAFGLLLSVADPVPGEPFVENAILPRAPAASTLADPPAVSQDRRWWALVGEPAGDEHTLIILDRESLDSPLKRPAARVTSLAFTPDNTRLIYLQASTDDAPAALYRLTLRGGEVEQIAEGNFRGPLVVDPGSDEVLLRQADGDGGFDLVAVDLDDGDMTPVFTATVTDEDGVTTRTTLIPLSWRP